MTDINLRALDQAMTLDPDVVQLLPYHLAKERGIIAARRLEKAIEVWLRPGVTAVTLGEARRVLGRPLRPVMLSAEQFDRYLTQAYSRPDSAATALMGDLETDLDLQQLATELPQVNDLLETEDDAPIIRLINAILTQSLRDGASDIHIEAFETRSVVRFRIDGVLRDILEPQRALHAAIVSRIKIMAALDIAEKRLPQDGRISIRLAGRTVDVRVSTLPTGHGERVVLRLLDKQSARLDLESLGLQGERLSRFQKLISEPHGIVLVTGPTGSGKTTTLYAALSALDHETLNMMTVEDPIEYDLDGINQTPVNARIDMSFARALRAILRQDPDVVMIGEIRDLETAEIAVQASLTGHLVLATLHTNDAPGAITRLADMGVEPFLLASSLLGVLAQRLVRRVCPACRQACQPDAAEQARLGGTASGPVYRAAGCEACNQTGYRGRMGIYELLPVDDGIRRLIHDHASEQAMRAYAVQQGMTSLKEDGVRLVLRGETTLEEVLRVATK